MPETPNNQPIELLKVTGYVANSTQKNKNENISEGESDLLKIAKNLFFVIKCGFSALEKGVGILFVWLKNFTFWLLRFLKKYFWLLAVFTVIGAGIGFFKARGEKPFYPSEMLVQATIVVPRTQVANRINNLDKLANSQSYTELAKHLKLNVDEVDDIFHIRAIIIKNPVKKIEKCILTGKNGEQTIVKDEVEEEGPQNIRIQIRLWDSKHVSKLNQAIITLIEEDPYIRERWNAFRQNNRKQRDVLREEILKLREFQQKNIAKEYVSTLIHNNNPVMVEREEKTYTDEILNLQNQILALEHDSILTKPLHVLQPLYTIEQPVDFHNRTITIFALFFLAFGFFAIAGCNVWRRMGVPS